MTESDFTSALCDVRSSFRILHSYITGIRDLVKYIIDRFGLEQPLGYPRWSGSSSEEDSECMTREVWDWLNMYYYEFKFEFKQDNAKSYYFSILLQSDSGAWDTEVDGSELNKTNKFGEVKDVKTQLIFIISKEVVNVDHFWNYYFFKSTGEVEFKEKNMFCKMYDLVQFKDLETCDNTLKDYEEYLKNKSFSKLKLKKSE